MGLIKQHEAGICSITENLSVSLLSTTKFIRVAAQALSRLSYEPRKKNIECHKRHLGKLMFTLFVISLRTFHISLFCQILVPGQ